MKTSITADSVRVSKLRRLVDVYFSVYFGVVAKTIMTLVLVGYWPSRGQVNICLHLCDSEIRAIALFMKFQLFIVQGKGNSIGFPSDVGEVFNKQ